MTRTDRAARRRELLDLLRTGTWSTQEALSEALAERGFEVSQATLSRDLHDLGAVRVSGPDGSRYTLPAEEAGAPAGVELMALEVTAVEANEAVVLVKTWAGRAQGVAISLDRLGLEDILGTVAGDDTILVIPRSVERVEALQRTLGRMLRPAPAAASGGGQR